ncbi:MAG TPA: tRNA pseudouridine(13) synthase TruD [Polyangiales bacterium]|nr:tRNA pseudouridine(13) synthase TruD [Polyangiales bacterium]
MSESLWQSLGALPRLTDDVPPISGVLKRELEDFMVEEQPAYLPTGEGEHLYLWVEKRGLNTPDAVNRLCEALGAPRDGSGYAGLKDKHAVTRQWLSFHTTKTPAPEELQLDGVRVLEVSRHVNKLRTGHLRGNRFTIRLADVPAEQDEAIARVLARLGELGLPNYYGPQRFGHEGRNFHDAWRWIVEGGRSPAKPFLRKLFVSTLQSGLFNAWLGDRVTRGALSLGIPGDVMRKEETGGIFVSSDAAADAPRVASWEISATGPMFGAKMRPAEAEALELETALLERFGVTAEHLARVSKFGEGTRRPARVRVSDVAHQRDGADTVLSFTLPKGSYATVLIAELTKARGLTLGDDP